MKTHTQLLRTAAVALFATAAFVNAPVFGQAAAGRRAAVAGPGRAAASAPVAVTPPAVTPAPAPRAAPPPHVPAPGPGGAPDRALRAARRRAAAPASCKDPARSGSRCRRPLLRLPRCSAGRDAAPPPAAEPAAESLRPRRSLPTAVEPSAAQSKSKARPCRGWSLAGLALVIALAGFVFLRRRRSTENDYYYEETAYEEPSIVAEPVASGHGPRLSARARHPAFRRAEPEPVAEPEVVDGPRRSHRRARGTREADRPTSRPRRGCSGPWRSALARNADAADPRRRDRRRHGGRIRADRGQYRRRAGRGCPHLRLDAGVGRLGDGEPADRSAGRRDLVRNAASSRATARPSRRPSTLPREAIDGAMLPVVVTDARYRLPDGSEGRTSASLRGRPADRRGARALPGQCRRAASTTTSRRASMATSSTSEQAENG